MLDKLHCPACNAPLDYDGRSSTIVCPYCRTKVVVPDEWRADEPPSPPPRVEYAQTFVIVDGPVESASASVEIGRGSVYDLRPAQKRSGCGAWAILLVLLVTGALIAAVFFFVTPMSRSVESIASQVTNLDALQEVDLAQNARTLVSQVSGSLAPELLRFGGEGIGPGKFADARAIAVDGQGRIYVGEYATGRIQVFDDRGEFVAQYTLGDGDFYVDQFAVDRNGVLIVPYDGEVLFLEGATGVQLGALPYPEAADRGQYDDSALIGPDGSLYAVWDDDIVRFDRNQQLTLRLENAIENATAGLETTTKLAVDGLGNIYALGESMDVIVKFAPDGRFVDRLAGRNDNSGAGDDEGSLDAASSLVVDGQGNLLVGDIFGIKVYGPTGQFLGTIDTAHFPFGLTLDVNDNLFVAEGIEVAKYAPLKQE